MSNFSNPDWLKANQYNNVDKLSARIRLHERFSTSTKDIHRWFFDFLLAQAPANATILELGCGRGDIWKKNADRIPADWKITLTDFSPGMLTDCKQHLGDELAARFAFDVIDAQNIPNEDHSLDIVIANMMLYHVPDRPKALSEIRRVLKPSGVLLAMTVGENHMLEIFSILQRIDSSYQMHPAHAPFTLQNGIKQLKPYFSDVRVDQYHDGLYVTELQALLDYIASMVSAPADMLSNAQAPKVSAELQQQIENEGGITIQKEVGVFIASKP